MDADELAARDIVRLPQSLTDALDTLKGDAEVMSWLGADLSSAYLAHKRFEAELMADVASEEQCARYLLAY